MPKRDYTILLYDILDAIIKIEKYTYGMDYEGFCNNDMAVDAVIRNFGIIGEVSAHIPEEVKHKYPKVPWDKMKGMRNIVIHEYFGVEHDILWRTIKSSLSPLKEQIAQLLETKD